MEIATVARLFYVSTYMLTGKLLLKVRVSTHRHSHLLAPVLFVHKQHIQHVVDAEQRVHSVITVEYLLEVDHSTTLFGEFIYQIHHLKTTKIYIISITFQQWRI